MFHVQPLHSVLVTISNPMDDGRMVSNVIVQAMNNEAITIFGDGSQTRAFCVVDDMIEGMVRLMNTPEDYTGPGNLANPDVFTIRMLADLVIELCGSNSKIEFKPLPSDDPSQRQPDITLAREALGWEPGTELSDGLQKTITYFDSLLRSPD